MRTELRNRIEIGTKNEKKTISQQFMKLQEECGEFSSAVQKQDRVPGSDYKPVSAHEDLEEGCDVLLVVYSMLLKRGYTIDQIEDKLFSKSTKWLEIQEQELEQRRKNQLAKAAKSRTHMLKQIAEGKVKVFDPNDPPSLADYEPII